MTTRSKSVSKTRQERQPFDLYCTPYELALKLCQWLLAKGINPRRLLEPSAGHGYFVRAARVTWPDALIIANEIQEKLVTKEHMREYLLACAVAKKQKIDLPVPPTPTLYTREVLAAAGASAVLIGDFLAMASEQATPFDLIIGNPPYSLGGGAEEHVRKGLLMLNPGGVLAYVLKMHFRGTDKRIAFWNAHPFAADPPIVPRPDFTGDGRDTVEYTFYCWHRALENNVWKIHCAPAIEWRK